MTKNTTKTKTAKGVKNHLRKEVKLPKKPTIKRGLARKPKIPAKKVFEIWFQEEDLYDDGFWEWEYYETYYSEIDAKTVAKEDGRIYCIVGFELPATE
jgi:hypothetical protein